MKKPVIIASILAVCLIGITLLVVAAPWKSDDKSSDGAQSFTGKIVCLPKSGDGPQTMECAFGLQTDDSTYYKLANSPSPITDVNTKVKVKGTVTPPADDEIYDIDGIIQVQSLDVVE